MFNLTHITVKEFFQVDEETSNRYLELQSNMWIYLMKLKEEGKDISFLNKPFLKYKAKKLGSLSFGNVAQLKRYIANPTYESLLEAFKMVYGVRQNQYLNADVVSFFYALNHIRESVIAINKKEKQLHSEPDADLQNAGVERLNRFGEMGTLINLGKQYAKSPAEIEEWKYNLVYAILLYDKVHGEIKKKYDEIKKPTP